MGKARILSAQGEGLYSIEILEDRTRAESLKQRALQRIDEIDSELSGLESDLEQARQKVDDAAEAQDQAIEQHQAEILATGESSVDLQAPAQAVLDAAANRDAIRTRIGSLNLERLQQQGWIDRVDALPALRTQEAWCADYTEDLDGEVATAEVPGEIGQVIIKPGFEDAAAWSASADGAMQPALAGTPAGVFYNLAMMPGWQRWRPTFRIAKISNINNDLCDITIDAAASSQQGLNVNAQGSYSGVPIYYMSCNGAAFEDGDRVLVAFSGNTEQPMVVGFESEPRGCRPVFSGAVFMQADDLLPIPKGTQRTGKIVYAEGTGPCSDPGTHTFTYTTGTRETYFWTPLSIPRFISDWLGALSAYWIPEDMLEYAETEVHKTLYAEGGINCTLIVSPEYVTEQNLQGYHEFKVTYKISLTGGRVGEALAALADTLEITVTTKEQVGIYISSAPSGSACSYSREGATDMSMECVFPGSEPAVVYTGPGVAISPPAFYSPDDVGVVFSSSGVIYITLSLRVASNTRNPMVQLLYAVAPDGQRALCSYSGFWETPSNMNVNSNRVPSLSDMPFTFVQDEAGNWEPFYG